MSENRGEIDGYVYMTNLVADFGIWSQKSLGPEVLTMKQAM